MDEIYELILRGPKQKRVYYINTTIRGRKQEPTDGVGVPSPQPGQDRVMKTTPLAGYVVIVPSCLCWGEGTPTPSVGAPTVVKDKHLHNKPVAV